MNVHLVGKTTSIVKDAGWYETMKSAIRKQGHMTGDDFSQATYAEILDGDLDAEDWRLLCERDLVALEQSEAVIIDVSDRGVFSMGYMAALALQAGMPVLLLIEETAKGGSFTCGLEHPMITRRIFNKGNIEVIIGDFLAQVEVQVA